MESPKPRTRLLQRVLSQNFEEEVFATKDKIQQKRERHVQQQILKQKHAGIASQDVPVSPPSSMALFKSSAMTMSLPNVMNKKNNRRVSLVSTYSCSTINSMESATTEIDESTDITGAEDEMVCLQRNKSRSTLSSMKDSNERINHQHRRPPQQTEGKGDVFRMQHNQVSDEVSFGGGLYVDFPSSSDANARHHSHQRRGSYTKVKAAATNKSASFSARNARKTDNDLSTTTPSSSVRLLNRSEKQSTIQEVSSPKPSNSYSRIRKVRRRKQKGNHKSNVSSIEEEEEDDDDVKRREKLFFKDDDDEDDNDGDAAAVVPEQQKPVQSFLFNDLEILSSSEFNFDLEELDDSNSDESDKEKNSTENDKVNNEFKDEVSDLLSFFQWSLNEKSNNDKSQRQRQKDQEDVDQSYVFVNKGIKSCTKKTPLITKNVSAEKTMPKIQKKKQSTTNTVKPMKRRANGRACAA